MTCTKYRFPDKHSADVAVTDAKLARVFHGNRRRQEERAYECRNCGGWHLTSQELARPFVVASR